MAPRVSSRRKSRDHGLFECGYTLLLLRAVAEDLISSRAEGATEYATNDEFRRVVDEVSATNE